MCCVVLVLRMIVCYCSVLFDVWCYCGGVDVLLGYDQGDFARWLVVEGGVCGSVLLLWWFLSLLWWGFVVDGC